MKIGSGKEICQNCLECGKAQLFEVELQVGQTEEGILYDSYTCTACGWGYDAAVEDELHTLSSDENFESLIAQLVI